MTTPSANIRSREQQFAPRLETKITEEIPSPTNPYHVKNMRIHGYDHSALMEKCEFSDVIFLLFRGELPNDFERDLFRKLCIALINPGPRHPATQASITAGVGKTDTVNVLPIALTIYGGEFDGAANVESTMRYFRRASRRPTNEVATALESNSDIEIPGFGQLYGDADPYAEALLNAFSSNSSSPLLSWIIALNTKLKQKNIGISKAGLCAAILAELGFQPRQGNALMQLMAAPGLLAHGMEYANKPLTSMLFEPDECYEIEQELAGSAAPEKTREVV